MKTELLIEDPKPEAGLKIRCYKYSVRNFRLHKVLDTLARMALWTIESRSNNAAAVVAARDSRTAQALWSFAKTEFARAIKFKDSPIGTLERHYEIAVPTPSEIQAVSNIKMKSLALELAHLIDVIIACDSAYHDVFIGDGSQADLQQAMAYFEDFLNSFLGTGALKEGSDPDAPAFDTGVIEPEGLRILGQVMPDVDLDWGGLQEPSSDVQPARVPDVADVDTRAAK